MKSFMNYVIEAYGSSKNTHMTHIEDAVIYGGVNGARSAINALRSMRDMLQGNAPKAFDTTVKWDGAPAIFVGPDPIDGQFFIAKKGIFAKNPKVYKSIADIKADTSGDLADKLIAAFDELKDIGIKTIIQGDLMFTKGDLKKETIDGESYVTFGPNTIIYAVPVGSDLEKKISKAKVGVVFHTTYTGSTFENMTASYGANLSGLKSKSSLWIQDASYKDQAGKVTFDAQDTAIVGEALTRAGKIFNQISSSVLKEIENNPAFAQKLEQFNNTLTRRGESITNTTKHVEDLIAWFTDTFAKEREKRKSVAGKASVSKQEEEVMAFFSDENKRNLALIYDLQNAIVDAKLKIIEKLNTIKQTSTFVRTKSGFKVTNPEGYVAIDHTTNGAVKLVDRLTFSFNNFDPNTIKSWMT